MVYLLTWHMSLVCVHRQSGALVHRALPLIADDVEPAVLDVPLEFLQPSFAHYLQAISPTLPDSPPGILQKFRMQWTSDQRTITFEQEGRLLSAEAGREELTLVRTKVGDWEAFLPLSQADLDALQLILRSSWVVRSSGELVERAACGRFFNLKLGSLTVDVRSQVPLDLTDWPFRLTLLRDGWRIEQICQYRPLIYYTAFGSDDILQQFAISVSSLIRFGQYQGPILLLTDRTRAELAALLPPENLARVAIMPFRPSDRPGFLAARYLIVDWLEGWQFQPLLYVDADIVFDRDVAPMLHAIATSDRIAAPVELQTTLARHVASGASLMQRDQISPGYMAGFNSGTLGIPNLRHHASTLRLIRQIIMNHSVIHGRTSLPFVDQEVANYVSFRLAHVDTVLVSRYVRYGGENADIHNRCGLFHFWMVAGAANRAQAMREYVTRLEAAT